MAYQSAEMAKKLNNAMAGRNDVATNNADPVRQMQDQSRGGSVTTQPMQEKDEGIDWLRIGRMMHGFGAGYNGRFAQLAESRRKDAESRQKLRQDAYIDDSVYLNNALKNGDMPSFFERLDSRIKFGTGQQFDMTDSIGLRKLATTDPKAAQRLTQRNVDGLISRDLVKAPPAVKTITVYNEETGRNEIRVLGANGQLGRMVGLAKQGEGKQTINVGSGETTEMKELSKAQVLRYTKGQEKGDVARDMIFSLDKLYAMDDLNTGALAPLQQSLGQMANALGMNDDLIKTYLNTNVSQGQTFIAETASMILKIMATQKGPQTNEDRIQIAKTIADLGNTPEANRFINNSARAIARRDINRAEFEQEHYDRTGSVKGSTQAWRKSIGGVPMISKHQRDSVGLPLFYHDFFDAVKNVPENENVSNKDILKEWKKQEAEAKQRMTNKGSK